MVKESIWDKKSPKSKKTKRTYKKKTRVLWGSEKKDMGKMPKTFKGEACPDCGTPWGRPHYSDTFRVCDAEQCPICGGQLMTCGHKDKVKLPDYVPGKEIIHTELPKKKGGVYEW